MRPRLLAVLTCALFPLVAALPAAADSAVSASDTPAGPIGVDAATTPATTQTLTVAADPAAVVVGATVTVDFQSISGENCAAPGPGTAYDDELSIVLTAPDGTHAATLVAPNTYTDGTPGPRVQVVFDDTATDQVGTTAGNLVTAGTFRPVAALSALNGAVANGSWTLVFGDVVGWDAKCYYGSRLDLTVAVPPTLPGGALTDGAVGQPYSVALLSSAGDLPMSFALASGTLPPGLTLDSTGAVTGTATTPGHYTFAVTATNTAGTSAAASYTVYVVLPGGDLGTGAVGSPFSATLAPGAAGITQYALNAGTPLPAGLSLDTTTGVVSGTPTTPGHSAFRVRARTAAGWSDHARYTIGVLPTLPGGLLTTGTAGTPYPAAAVIPDTTGISEFRLGPQATLPAGLNLDTVTGAITGTPTTPGDYHFRVQARVAGVGWTDLVRYDLGVLAVLPGGTLTHGAVGSSYTAPLIADPVGITHFVLTQSSSPLPAGMALDETTGVVSGTPAVAGAYAFSVRARVAGVGASERADYALAVLPTLAGRTLPAGTARTAFSARLGDPATGIDSFVLAAGSALPPGLTLNPTTGVLSGTPTTAGTYTFAVLAANTAAGTSQPATFTVVLAAAPAEALAATGADLLRGGLLALALLGTGILATVVARRRSTR